MEATNASIRGLPERSRRPVAEPALRRRRNQRVVRQDEVVGPDDRRERIFPQEILGDVHLSDKRTVFRYLWQAQGALIPKGGGCHIPD
jgi:hypothetical protein